VYDERFAFGWSVWRTEEASWWVLGIMDMRLQDG